MAKISFDFGKLMAEPRFVALSKRLGGEDKALWCLMRFWNCALEHWSKGRKLVPAKTFALDDDWQYLVAVDLAEAREEGFYAKGAKDHFDWIIERQDSASAAGQASARARAKKYGSANPRAEIVNDSGTSCERPVNDSGTTRERPRTNVNASSFTSSSVSTSKQKTELSTAKSVSFTPEDEAVAKEWFEMAKRHSTTVSYSDTWADTVRMLREIDKVSHETLRQLMEFVEADDFWRINALSIVKLRARSKQNGLLKWENAIAKMREGLEFHGLTVKGDPDPWAGFEELTKKLAGK